MDSIPKNSIIFFYANTKKEQNKSVSLASKIHTFIVVSFLAYKI
jgi:hypothetical protein